MTGWTIFFGSLRSATFLAAVLGSVTTVCLARKKVREDDRARRRETYARAFEAVAAYKELPYAIRRRGTDNPAEERKRLAEDGRAIQQKLSYYQAWIRGESRVVGNAYDILVAELRTVAGKASHDAWNEAPAQSDPDMNIEPIDLTKLKGLEDNFITKVQEDLRR